MELHFLVAENRDFRGCGCLSLIYWISDTHHVGDFVQAVAARCAQLEQDLRKSKRREEKLTALQFRLKEDARQMGTDPRLARFA